MKDKIFNKCQKRFEKMDIWYIVDNIEQLKIIRGIIREYLRDRKLSPRQAVRLYDFANDESIYKVYSKGEIMEKYRVIDTIYKGGES